jgi:urease accessory protein
MFTQAESQLRLWQLISPTLPIGNFAYSQGLEYAVEAGWVSDEAQTAEWIKGQLRKTLSVLDVPVMQRLYSAWQVADDNNVIYWNEWLLAARGSKELRDEDIQLGQSLLRVLKGLDITLPIESDIEWSYAAMFSYAAVTWDIPFKDSATGLLWSWSENQVAAAIKLVPLGQTAGQRVLSAALKEIPAAIERTKNFTDDDIGVLAQGLGIASALHETQYSRLFRS